MRAPEIIDLRDAPLALYLVQIAANRRGHHPLVDLGGTETDRQLYSPQTPEQRERQTDLLLAARERRAA